MTHSPRPIMHDEQVRAQTAADRTTPPTVSIIVVSYNTRQMTLECLRSVFEQTHRTTFEIIVIDNESADGSADAIEAEFAGRLRLIRSGANLGFAKANNVAAEHATGDYLLLLNPDTLVLDAAIDRLVEFARTRPEAKIWGGRTVYADGSLNPASCWGRQTLWSVFCAACGLSSLFRRTTLFNPEGIGGWARDSIRQVDIVSGCFFLVRREFWKRLNGFDPAFFMYGEEADLCLRASALGARPLISHEAVIIHYGGASERVRVDKMVRLLQAKVRLIRRHWSAWTRDLGVWMLSLWPMSRAIAWRVHGVGAAREPAHTWSEVYRRRTEWIRDTQ